MTKWQALGPGLFHPEPDLPNAHSGPELLTVAAPDAAAVWWCVVVWDISTPFPVSARRSALCPGGSLCPRTIVYYAINMVILPRDS